MTNRGRPRSNSDNIRDMQPNRQLAVELGNAPRHSLRSCPRRDLFGSTATERHPLGGLSATLSENTMATSRQSATAMLQKIMPEFPCDNVDAAVAHYRDVLGFSVNYAQHDIGVMD